MTLFLLRLKLQLVSCQSVISILHNFLDYHLIASVTEFTHKNHIPQSLMHRANWNSKNCGFIYIYKRKSGSRTITWNYSNRTGSFLPVIMSSSSCLTFWPKSASKGDEMGWEKIEIPTQMMVDITSSTILNSCAIQWKT